MPLINPFVHSPFDHENWMGIWISLISERNKHDLHEAISTVCFLPSKNVLKQVFKPKQTHWDI